MTDAMPVKASPERMAQLLRDQGYKGKVYEVDGIYAVESGADGHPFRLHFYGPSPKEEDAPCTAFQIETGWRGVPAHEAVKLIAVCNTFNARARYTTASIVGDSGQPYLCLSWDHYYPEGLTDEHFTFITDIFVSMMGRLYSECKAVTNESRDSEILQRHDAALLAAHGPDRDHAGAARLYRLNADDGYAGSQNNLGDMYETGEGVPQNPLAAVHYYTRAAERAEPTAYLSLATILSEKTDDTEILVEALKFAHLAAAGLPEGHNMADAREAIDLITAKLEEDCILRAHELARQWKPLFVETRTMGDRLSRPENDSVESNSLH